MPNTRVIVDTSVWIDFLKNQGTPSIPRLKRLLLENRVIVVGIVLAELLQGASSSREKDFIEQLVASLPYEELRRQHWIKAGELSNKLRKKGVTLPLTDLLVAALALDKRWAVFTLDPHFGRIEGLKVY